MRCVCVCVCISQFANYSKYLCFCLCLYSESIWRLELAFVATAFVVAAVVAVRYAQIVNIFPAQQLHFMLQFISNKQQRNNTENIYKNSTSNNQKPINNLKYVFSSCTNS